MTGEHSFKSDGQVKATFAKISEERDGNVKDLYITEIRTPKCVMYLPSHTEDKFNNLVEQIKKNKVEILVE